MTSGRLAMALPRPVHHRYGSRSHRLLLLLCVARTPRNYYSATSAATGKGETHSFLPISPTLATASWLRYYYYYYHPAATTTTTTKDIEV